MAHGCIWLVSILEDHYINTVYVGGYHKEAQE